MASHVHVAGVWATGQAQVKPDQAAMLAPGKAFAAFKGVVGGRRWGQNQGRLPLGTRANAIHAVRAHERALHGLANRLLAGFHTLLHECAATRVTIISGR